MTDRFILCMKYGRAYPADYVNVLYNASRRALRRTARFVYLTDDRAGLLPEIEALSIPDIGLRSEDWFRPGVWPKVALFDAHFHGLRGRALFIDLDMVIASDLDAFLDLPGRFVGTNSSPGWGKPGQHLEQPEFGSMIFAYNLGEEEHISEIFRADREG